MNKEDEGQSLTGLIFSSEKVASDSIEVPAIQEPVQVMYSNSKVNFNVFLDFSLDADSVMKAFDEGLWAK
ncbi:hypothetical protein BSL78_07023 [Apostichopus japonicus]|uniref:Uncharacterized protein n=1 Tax=Stichopus japonicus TaxID=307972 RepID=A0A2G8L725_STIJA|nr:hypothetical protein BSL78_07023 [Apostichopus japonicus]